MSRRIISFDVGIKNMAYCIFDVSGQAWTIIDWNTVNLLETPPTQHHTCTECLSTKRSGKDASILTPCGKRAKYEKNGTYYCETHGKKSGYMMPSKSTYPGFLKKQKIGELHKIAMLYKIEGVALKEKRQDLIQKILDFFDRRSLKLLENKPPPNANKESLITIARSIRDKLDIVDYMKGVTDVLIENQIFTVASRMATIQGLLTQYFVMRHDPVSPIRIEFISSRNKLKDFSSEDAKAEAEPQTQTQIYKSHKKDSVEYTKQLLEKYPECKAKWGHMLDTAKKDDLADCFLQGVCTIRSWGIAEI